MPWLLPPWTAAPLVGWNVAATAFIAWIWFTVAGMDAASTAKHAAIEDPSRATAGLILILAGVVRERGRPLASRGVRHRRAREGDDRRGRLGERDPFLGDRAHRVHAA